jgi:uncharacterized protein
MVPRMRAIEVILEALGRAQSRRPILFVLGALAIAVAAAPFAAQLRLNGDFTALLPEDKPSVRDLDVIEERFGGKSTLTVMFEHPEVERLRDLVRSVAPRLEQRSDLPITAVDWSVRDFIEFAEANRFLYADIETLEELSDELQARLRYEMAKTNPLLVNLDEGPPPDPEEVARKLEKTAEEAQTRMERYPEGLFQHPELPLVAVFIRTSIRGGDPSAVADLLSGLETEVARAKRQLDLPEATYYLGGDLMDIKEESDALTRAVIFATSITIVLVLLSIYFFFRRIRSIPLLGLALLSPVLATFALAWASVEYLNASTAFLSSIVVGNGINPNVIWLARYFELRRARMSVAEAVRGAHSSTWAATLTASLAAGLAYGSLIITDFRGFRDFGIIGGAGMALCWIGAYTVLPALTVLFDRRAPVVDPERGRGGDHRSGRYGALFAKLATSRPGLILGAAGLLAVASVFALVQWLQAGPLEYDFRNLQSVRPADSRVQWVNDRQAEIVDETTTGSAIAILLDDRDEASAVVEQLEKLRKEDPDLLGAIRTVQDFVPDHQRDKLDVLEEIRDVAPRLEEYADEEQKELLREHTPPEGLKPIEAEDLPASITRLFTDRQGELGRIVFVEHHEDRNAWDGQYLIEWSDAARSVRLSDGERPPVVGQPAIFSDLLDAIFDDGPRAVGVALAATALLLFFTFRHASERLLTLGALLLGILWMAALMAVAGIKLNFLNFVAFPITFGNGVDYGVNVMRRYVQENEVVGDPSRAVTEAVQETGGAVILCSLTTIIGYISLYTSSNKALNSFGAAMAISEITCVVAGVLVVPAALAWAHRRRRNP